MDKSCLQMAHPGKCGFFLLGMFFMLAFASWSLVTRSQGNIDITVEDADVHLREEKLERELQNDNELWYKDKTNIEKDDSIEVYKDEHKTLLDGIKPQLSSNQNIKKIRDEEIGKAEKIPTFLSTLDHSFIRLAPDENGGVATVQFLEACAGPKDMMTMLGSIMGRVWADVGNNIKILQTRYDSDPSKFSTLQQIVLDDIAKGVASNDGSAAMAVLWLKRTYDFVAEFFDNLRQNMEPSEAASKAYEVSLAPHHRFYVRPIFYGAMKTLGSQRDFLLSMALKKEDVDNPAFAQSAFDDMGEFTTALRKVLKVLDDYLTEKKLNNL